MGTERVNVGRGRVASTGRRFALAIGRRFALAIACAVLVAACAAGSASRTAEPEQHPMDVRILTEVMRGFAADVREAIPAETDEYDRWDGVFPRIADAAAQVKASAVVLMGHPPKGLELPARGRFQVLARSLENAALQLEEAAARGDADAVEIARKQLGYACRDCHEHFRPDAKGVPEAFR